MYKDRISSERFIGDIHIDEDSFLEAILKSRPKIIEGEEYIHLGDFLENLKISYERKVPDGK